MKVYRKAFLGFMAMHLLGMIIGWAPVLAAVQAPILDTLQGAEKARVAKLIAGARKEGKLVFRSHSMGSKVFQFLAKDFKQLYGLPNHDMKHALMRGGSLLARVRKEIKAGVPTADVIHLGCPNICKKMAKRGELMKYWSPEYAAFDPEVTSGTGAAPALKDYYISGMVSYFGIAYNKKLTKRDITKWEDLLDPAFKGKIVVSDISRSFTSSYTYVGFRRVLPLAFWKRLAREQQPAMIMANREIVNKLVAGEYAIGVFITSSLPYREQLRGNTFIKAVHPGNMQVPIGYQTMILKSARNPNTAKLFIDYFHSKRGLSAAISRMGYAPGRSDLDIPKEVDMYSPPTRKMKLIKIDWTTFSMEDLNKYKKEFRSVFFGPN